LQAAKEAQHDAPSLASFYAGLRNLFPEANLVRLESSSIIQLYSLDGFSWKSNTMWSIFGLMVFAKLEPLRV
jgi:hypothetical protein